MAEKTEMKEEPKLKPTVAKRVEKLKKLRRSMRLWASVGTACAVITAAPLVYYLVCGGLPSISFINTLNFSGPWAPIIGAIIVGLTGSMLSNAQHRRTKEKFDKIRAGTVELLQATEPICQCNWTHCSCKDELIEEMNKEFDINLSY